MHWFALKTSYQSQDHIVNGGYQNRKAEIEEADSNLWYYDLIYQYWLQMRVKHLFAKKNYEDQKEELEETEQRHF